MLAVRLHKKKRPSLNKGAFLIPIMSWQAGKLQIRDWVWTLNNQNKGGPNNAIRYITLVKIPDDHPIAMFADWAVRQEMLEGKVIFKPLQKHKAKLKSNIKKWHEYNLDRALQFGRTYSIPLHGGPLKAPELILGKALPKSCIKWTKDIKLLYGKKPKDKQQ